MKGKGRPKKCWYCATISKWFKKDSKYALATIKARTGLDLKYIETKSGECKLVKKEVEA